MDMAARLSRCLGVLMVCLFAISGEILAATSTVRNFTAQGIGQCFLKAINVTDTCNITTNVISCTRTATSSPQQCAGNYYGNATATIATVMSSVYWLKDSYGHYVDGVVCATTTIGETCWQLTSNGTPNYPSFNTLTPYPVTDTDSDGVNDLADNCTYIANPDQLDTDSDYQGNACDDNDDNDCALDRVDPEPLNVANCKFWPLDSGYRGSSVTEAATVQ